jgi:hypothetical protein
MSILTHRASLASVLACALGHGQNWAGSQERNAGIRW